MLALGVAGTIGASLMAGSLAEHPTTRGVWLLAICALGSAVFDTAGRYLWVTVVNRAAGKLRHDLVDAVFAQPLSQLSEQAVGEVLDRVDDDTHEVNTLLRFQIWMAARTTISALPMWIVAGLQWWPAWVLFPLFGVLTWLLMRKLLPSIAALKIQEEQAWTDHAAALEEGIAGRDDLRTSLGQPFAMRRLAQLSRAVHERFVSVITVQRKLAIRTGITLHALLVLIVLGGALLAGSAHMSIGSLVTVFLITSSFVGLAARFAEQIPDLQAGLGAVVRLRQLMEAESESVTGELLPDGPLDLEFRDVTFGYTSDKLVLEHITAHIPAGRTIALVGRTGSGKSTLASLISRAEEPGFGQVFLGGMDVTRASLHSLRPALGVVTQRTEILSGTLAENISLFAPIEDDRVNAILAELGLTDWAQSLPDGIHTLLGAGGLKLSAGEEQLIAFARLLARNVRVVILDEATARMDPVTEARVVAASQRLLANRTGVLIAHRLTTIRRADYVMVLADGRVVEFGPYRELEQREGQFRALLDAAGEQDALTTSAVTDDGAQTASARRSGEAQAAVDHERVSLASSVWKAINVQRSWGMLAVGMFLILSICGSAGPLTGFGWGNTVEALKQGHNPWGWAALTSLFILIGPVALVTAVARYPRWWIEVLLRVRMNVLIGQTGARKLAEVPPGEVVSRAMDADRLLRYTDRWVDFVNGLIIVVITACVAGTYVAGVVLLVIMVASAAASALGRPIAGRSAAKASQSRAAFGRALVSALESIRTVKLAGRTQEVREHLRSVDGGRVEAAVREHRVSSLLDGVPPVMVQAGIVAAWAGVQTGTWGLATALLIANAAAGFDWFGRVAGSVVTEAPGTRSWLQETTNFAGGRELTSTPDGVDLPAGVAPAPIPQRRETLHALELQHVSAAYPDGTVGVQDVVLQVRSGELVLLVGPVGSGKSTLLAMLAGLVSYEGELLWNGHAVTDPQSFLRPGNVAYVAQTPRVFSGSLAANIHLDHARDLEGSIDVARLHHDVEVAGGHDALVGHRGVKLSGGQVQRLALARALATEAELLLADDISSALDAATENELWGALRARGVTVIGSTSKRAALRQADRVLVMGHGRVLAQGPWQELEQQWGHLAG